MNLLSDDEFLGGSASGGSTLLSDNQFMGGAAKPEKPAPERSAAPTGDFKGLVEPGNIDLAKRPVVKNDDGSVSTVRSMSFEQDGKEILIPTVSPDGKILSDEDAIKLYQKTGQHLGVFDNADDATAYAQALHGAQADFYTGKPQASSGVLSDDEFLGGSPPAASGGFIDQVKKGFISGLVDQNPQMVGNAMDAIAELSDGPSPGDLVGRMVPAAPGGKVRPMEESPQRLRDLAAQVKEWGAQGSETRQPNVPSVTSIRTDSLSNMINDAADYAGYVIGSGAGTSAPSLAVGVAGAAVTKSPLGFIASAAGPSYVQNLGDTYGALLENEGVKKALAEGKITRKQVASIAAGAAIPMAALDAASLEGVVGLNATGLKQNIVKRIIQRVGVGALTEGTTEGIQQVVQEAAIDAAGGDKTLAQQAVSVIDNAIGGALAGGAMGAGASPAAGHMAKEAAPPVNEQSIPQGAASADTLFGQESAAEPPPSSADTAAGGPPPPPAATPADIERDRPNSPRLTAEDRASPLPDALIDDGKAIFERALNAKDARTEPSAGTSGVDGNEVPSVQPEPQVLPPLRRPGDNDVSGVGVGLPGLSGGGRVEAITEALNREDRQQQGVRTGQRSVGDAARADGEHVPQPDSRRENTETQGGGSRAALGDASFSDREGRSEGEAILPGEVSAPINAQSDLSRANAIVAGVGKRDGNQPPSDQVSSGRKLAGGAGSLDTGVSTLSTAKGLETDADANRPAMIENAAQLDAAGQRVNTEPTEAQKESGNYKKAHVSISGMDITIENPKGSVRRGTDPDGSTWEATLPATYGYVKGTEARDGDHVDVYVGDQPTSPKVYVIDQVNPDTKAYDEPKAMLGFNSREEALSAYQKAFSDKRGAERVGAVTEMNTVGFKGWLKNGDTTKPLSYAGKSQPAAKATAEPAVEPKPDKTDRAAPEPQSTLKDKIQAKREEAAKAAESAPSEKAPAKPEPKETAKPSEDFTEDDIPAFLKKDKAGKDSGERFKLTPTDAFKAKAQDVGTRLRAELDRLGLKDIGLRISENLGLMVEGKFHAADGSYFQKLITVALDADNPDAVLDHEAIHALHDVGAFSPADWAILERKSRKEWRDKYQIGDAYGSFSDAVQTEEGIAHAYADWRSGRSMDGIIAKAFKKIRGIIQAIGRAFGKDFRSAEDVFEQVASGEVGNRSGDESGGIEKFALQKPMDSKAFKRWFGDSKVVDAAGNPLIVHHGGVAGIEKFESSSWRYREFMMPEVRGEVVNANFFTSDHSVAESYRARVERENVRDGDKPGALYDVYLSLQNPMTVDWRGKKFTTGDPKALIKQAQEGDHDGLIVTNVVDDYHQKGKPTTIYVTFDSAQIKSAENPGIFDPADPRIMFKLRSEPQTAEDRQKTMQGFIARGQPLDRALRLPFEFLGGVDAKGRWKPGLYVTDKAAKIITTAKIDPEGRFGWLAGPVEAARAGLVDRYGLSPEYIERDRQRHMDERTITMRGAEVLKTLADQNVGPNEARVLQAILTGEAVSDKDMQGLAAPIRQAIDELGQEAVTLGLISAESFERNRGSYLHRVYAKHEAEQNNLQKLVSQIMGSKRKKILGDTLKGRGLFWEVGRDQLLRHSSSAQAMRKADSQIGGIEKRVDDMKSRREVLEGEMEALGREMAAHMGRRMDVADRATIKKMVGESRTTKPSSFQKGQVLEQAVALNRLRDRIEQREAALDKIDGEIAAAEQRIEALSDHLISQSENLAVTKDSKFVVLDKTVDKGDGKPSVAQRVYLPADDQIPERFSGPEWTNRGTWEARQIGKNKVTLWRDYSQAERTKMGEILDARYTIGKTYIHMAHDLAVGRFYKDIAENEDWATASEPAAKWVEADQRSRLVNDRETAWVKVPDTTISNTGGKKRWGALSGKWVRSEIWRDLNEIDIMNRPSTWRMLLSQWKLNKTSRSPVTHMNNVMSNLMLMDMNDVRMQDLQAGLRSFVKKDKHWQDANEHGVFGADMMTQEIRDNVLKPILEEMEKQGQDGVQNSFLARAGILGKFADRLWSLAKTADRKMIDLYRIEDDVFRLASYRAGVARGESAEHAAAAAREQFFDYDIRAPWVNAARNSLLPFISYTYRAVPLIARAMATKPWKLAKYAMVAYALNALAYAWDDDADEDKERASLRDEEQGKTWLYTYRMMRMPFRNADGLPVFLDTRRWIPGGDVFDTNQGSSALPIPAPLQFGGPLMLAFELALNKSSFTGDPITNDLTDTWFDKSSKVGDYLWKSWMPSAAWVPNSWYWTKIENAAKGATDIKGRPYGLPEAVASSFGIKLKPQDVETGIFWQYKDMKDVEQALRAEARTLARQRDRGLISQKAFDSGMQALLDKRDVLIEHVKDLQRATRKK